MIREVFCTIYRTVLTSCTSEAYHQTCESATHICLNMRIHHSIYMLQKAGYLSVVFKEPYHRLIPSCQFLIWLITSGVMYRTAVKDISTTIAGRIVWNSPLE